MADFWTDTKESELVEKWQANECLYDCTHKDYANRVVRNKKHTEIAKSLGTSAAEVGKRINTLRTQFSRLVKPGKSGSGVTPKTGRQKWLLNTLSFLQPHVKKRNTQSNLQPSVDEDSDDEIEPVNIVPKPQDEIEGDDEERDLTTETPDKEITGGKDTADGTNLETPKTTKKQGGKRKRMSIDPIERAELELLSSMKSTLESSKMEEPDDEITVFGNYIVRQLRQIDDVRVRLTVQNEMQQACFRGRMSTWNNHSNSGGSFSFFSHQPPNQSPTQPPQTNGYTNVQAQPQPSTSSAAGSYQYTGHDNSEAATFTNLLAKY